MLALLLLEASEVEVGLVFQRMGQPIEKSSRTAWEQATDAGRNASCHRLGSRARVVENDHTGDTFPRIVPASKYLGTHQTTNG